MRKLILAQYLNLLVVDHSLEGTPQGMFTGVLTAGLIKHSAYFGMHRCDVE